MASPCGAACAAAVPMLRSEASTPVTEKPSRAIGSDRRPPAPPAEASRPQALEGPARGGIAGEPRQRLLADEAEPHRIEAMQRGELALRGPPLLGDGREALDLPRVDAGFRGGERGHGPS